MVSAAAGAEVRKREREREDGVKSRDFFNRAIGNFSGKEMKRVPPRRRRDLVWGWDFLHMLLPFAWLYPKK